MTSKTNKRIDGITDRQRGCLLGLAIGDALGAAVEFKPPGSFEPVVAYRGGGPWGLEPGEWTDDTSMALALADSIAHAGWDLNDQARRYVSWRREGAYSVIGRCFDIGNATSSALARFEQNEDATRSGDRSPSVSGNGSIMRLAPVPIRFVDLFPDQVENLAALAAESSLPTHASPQCLSACRYMSIVLSGLMNGVDRDQVLAADWPPLERIRAIEPLHPEVDAVVEGSFRRLKPPAIKGSSYAVKSLEAALWAFHDAKDYREAVLKAVNLGDDADTTGAVCGQLAGAFWGESGIPKEWLNGLAKKDMIEKALKGLLSMPSVKYPIQAGSSKPPSAVSTLAALNVEMPKPPVFLTSNAANKAENEMAVEQALNLARKGDVAGLRAQRLPPSPKLKAWHAKLVDEVARQTSDATTATPPTTSSYWVVPGRLLAGAYPGAEDDDEHRKNVRDLLNAGVRVFVNLMEEDETNHFGKPFRPYQDLVKSTHADVKLYRFPIRDESVPSVPEMASILDAIDRCLKDNRAVYIHCWGGVGRTGTTVACWLLRNGKVTRDGVLDMLADLRRQDRERGHRSAPETKIQREFVLSWIEPVTM